MEAAKRQKLNSDGENEKSAVTADLIEN
jgi:hypothetical protein